MAKVSGISQQTLYQMVKRNSRSVSIETLAKLAAPCGMTPGQFLDMILTIE
jgi:Flp pilus assembly protein CpaB